ncbi:MAG: MFS transporter, partial [Acidobacteriota bacterium]
MQPKGSVQNTGIFEGVTAYHWIVVIVASCGWLFDCMDQRIFVLARESALRQLLGSDAAAQAAIKEYLGYATTALIVGWATGGIIFGIMSDKFGRVRTMLITLLVYS